MRLKGKVAIVTGGGSGFGAGIVAKFVAEGAQVVVADLNLQAALDVAAAAGPAARGLRVDVANAAEVRLMMEAAELHFGRIDILVNNAGVLRDKTFAKMGLDDFRFVMDVHLMGAVHCTKAVWDIMRDANYGRIVMTTSSSGMYGNFGQSNYGAAKMAVLGFMNTLVLEGGKNNIHVNALAPTAGTRMTEDLLPAPVLAVMTPESVTAGALVLCAESAPTRTILCAGAGGYAKASMYETDGIFLPVEQQNPDEIVANWDALSDSSNQQALESGGKQTEKFVMKAMAALKA